ncbi:hypothetical protein MRB53_010028 [Persea americana]|uniref:Uncharacterized protein n=1 Tax=Persea americana TaxID=3435 RepID=A0ACC2LQS5_PERAE|nr:hypothetical protein MRB53_010028 [Persea americana]
MFWRKPVLILLFLTVLAPIVLYTDRLGSFFDPRSKNGFLDESSTINFGGEFGTLNALPQESLNTFKEPIGVVYLDSSGNSDGLDSEISTSNVGDVEKREFKEELSLGRSAEHKSRVLSMTAADGNKWEKENVIEQATNGKKEEKVSDGLQEQELDAKRKSDEIKEKERQQELPVRRQERKHQQHLLQTSVKVGSGEHMKTKLERQSDKTYVSDARVRHLKDQLIRAKVYLGMGPIRSNSQFVRELRLRMKEIQRALGDATKDLDLPKNADEKRKAMELTLARAKQIQDDCAAVIKKLRAMLHSAEEQLRVHKKQTLFLTQLAAKTLPKGLHCLPLRLSTEYYSLLSNQQQFPNQEKLEDPELYHYALFSDNILATAVVVNSTVFHAKDPTKHVFHIVTDRLNYAAMRMWFLANPPGKDYYFKTHRTNSDPNMKFRNPKYLSILNHLRFYLPEIFPKLDKVVFLDDDVVVQKDLTGLWMLNLKGKVNGAVETCGESFHRFDRYLNFSNPHISKNFNPRACGWAYGMNVFDLAEWRKQKITDVYHSWQKLNQDRQLWKLGTLPPGLITFWNRTLPLHRSWHVLGLGYDPNVRQKEIERAAVIHYNGNMKPWLEIGMPKYRNYWAKFVNYDQVYLRDCNINP